MRTSKLISGLATLAIVGGGGVAFGQFNNGDFETGNSNGWTIRNTSNGVGAPGTVEQYDIDGPGPKGSTYAAKFAVGQLNFMSGVQEGVEVVQNLNLTGGVAYTIRYAWGTRRDSGTGNAEGGVFAVIVDGQIIGTPFSSGGIGGSNGNAKYGEYSVVFTPGSSGTYEVGARITRPYTSPGDVFQYVDDFDIDPPNGGGLALSLSGSCPGQIGVSWSGATPNKTMGIVFAASTGSFVIPGGPCGGTTLGLSSSQLRLVNTVNTGSGSGNVNGNAGAAACGGYLQLVVVDGNPCTTSNTAQLQ